MRYGIFSDVHANLEAFEVVRDFYRGQSIDKFIFLGDIVGYGANPCEAIELLKRFKAAAIAGNHEWAVTGKCDIENFNIYARESARWTKEHLPPDDLRYLAGLPLKYNEKDFICVHSELVDPEKFNYITGSHDARQNFNFFEEKICFIGHSHRKAVFELQDDTVAYRREEEIELGTNKRYIVNVGSVGQPRDNNSKACCCVYDSQAARITFHRLEYDIKKAADKIIAAGLPNILAYRLHSGW